MGDGTLSDTLAGALQEAWAPQSPEELEELRASLEAPVAQALAGFEPATLRAAVLGWTAWCEWLQTRRVRREKAHCTPYF